MYDRRVAASKDREFDDHVSTAVMPGKDGPRLVGAIVRVVGVAAKPQEFRLADGVCRIGSGEANEIVIRDRTVSRQHAELTLTQEGVLLRDLESKNGTHYLGHRVGTMVLALGARVSLGAVVLEIAPDTEGLLDELSYEGTSYRGVLGASSRMRKLFALLTRLESSVATVLVEGESGVGKEVVARAIHEGSPVSRGALVTLNCGAIPKELVASELFGHKRGAFTGAIDARKGAFEIADGGTLFLDEIGELPLDVQPMLLRALEAGEIRPIGEEQVRRVKVRVVAATNRDLASEVAAGRFRQDLFYRLAVVRIHVPPLRARPDDIELLANAFAREARLAEIPRAVMDDLVSRAWPATRASFATRCNRTRRSARFRLRRRASRRCRRTPCSKRSSIPRSRTPSRRIASSSRSRARTSSRSFATPTEIRRRPRASPSSIAPTSVA
jgi:MoxR-like ATPase